MTDYEKIAAHNKAIDDFINVELAKKFSLKDGKIGACQWFAAQQLIREQGFYKKAVQLVKELRLHGISAKIDCQSDKIIV